MFSQFETAVTFQPVGGSNSYTYTMYPGVTPPVLYLNGNQESYGASVSIVGGNTLTMTPTGAAIYYTTDGNDPLESELNLDLASITISGTTATATVAETIVGLYNGDQLTISGADQSAYDGTFTVANVTVNSTADTTTFTYTVTGTPTPTSAATGTPLTASGNVGFTLNSLTYSARRPKPRSPARTPACTTAMNSTSAGPA